MGSSLLRRLIAGRDRSAREVIADRVALEKAKGDQPTPPSGYEYNPRDLAMLFAGDKPIGANIGAGGLAPETLREFAARPYVAPLIQRRLNQLAEFCVPQATPYSNGCKVILRDLKQQMTMAAEAKAHEILAVMLRGGGKYEPGGLQTFVKKAGRDSLTLDLLAGEIIPTRGGKPWGIKAIDAATVMRERPAPDAARIGQWGSAGYTQMIDNQVVRRWRQDEIIFGVRRPRTWTRSFGLGYPELEEARQVIDDLANAMTYNSVNFTNGVHASTILAVFSKMDPGSWEAFKMQITAMLHGVRNGKRMPMVRMDPGESGEGSIRDRIEAVNLSLDNEKMGYSDWLNFNFKLLAAILQMDAAEIGFIYGTEGVTSTLSSAGPADRIKYSKEGGLRPLLRDFEQWLNDGMTYRLDEDFHFAFVGLDALTIEEQLKLDKLALETSRTMNEIRIAADLPKIDSPVADWPANATFQQNAMALLQQQQGANADGAEGDGAEGEDERAGGSMGADWNNIDDWTQKTVAAVEKAWRSGAIGTRRVGSGGGKRRQVLVDGHGTDCASILVDVAA